MAKTERPNPTRRNIVRKDLKRKNLVRTNLTRKGTEDPNQYERFRKFAREVEADDDSEMFDRQFRKIVPPKAR